MQKSNPKMTNKISKSLRPRGSPTRRGLTLIELLISLGIIVLLTLLAIPLFHNANERNKLNLTAQEVKDAILETKNYALSPRKDKSEDFKFYAIEFQHNPTLPDQYFIYEVKKSSDNTSSDKNLIMTKSLPSKIIFISPTPTSIAFSIKDQGTITEPINEDIEVTLRNSNIGQNKSIIINRTSSQVKIP